MKTAGLWWELPLTVGDGRGRWEFVGDYRKLGGTAGDGRGR